MDLIPFRGVASEAKTIAWPPEGDFVMNVAGFEEGLDVALRIELESGLVIAVASLPGLAILKILAWADRHMENNKDAADLYRILNAYDSAGNQDRLFGSEIELLEAADYDLTPAGAQLLGPERRAHRRFRRDRADRRSAGFRGATGWVDHCHDQDRELRGERQLRGPTSRRLAARLFRSEEVIIRSDYRGRWQATGQAPQPFIAPFSQHRRNSQH